MGESFGVLLFGSADDFGAFLDTADQAIANEMPDVPPHMALNYERRSDLAVTLREEIEQYGWRL